MTVSDPSSRTDKASVATSSGVPLATIGIPTYNRLRYLKEAVASSLAQTYSNIEVLISDNGTDQGVKAWCDSLTASDGRVRYRRNPENVGMAGNWNVLAESARGDFLVIIGDDDRLLPQFLSTLSSAMEEGVSLVFSNHYVINRLGTRLRAASERWTRFYGRNLLPAGLVANAEICAWSNAIPISSALMLTADAKRLRFKDDLNTPEIEMFIRLAQEGARFAFVPEYLAEFRIHSGSTTSAGLWKDRLARYLQDIPVGHEVEPYKKRLLAEVLVDAVSDTLMEGRLEQARTFFKSPYYPRHRGGPISRLQSLCLSLPSPWGSHLYAAVSWLAAWLRRLARAPVGRDR